MTSKNDSTSSDLSGKTILVTGGTGSFGRQFVSTVLADHKPAKLIVFSRDELKQHEMREAGFDDPAMRYFIGDVRDSGRMKRAMSGVDVVVHAAALKQVPACEYNPIEAIKTNVEGAMNVIDAAIDAGVQKVISLSTDKAVNPINLYGATKLCAEKLFVQSNSYSGLGGTAFSSVRYGNVVGSRGSVVPKFLQQRQEGNVTITDLRMTRFWITLEQGARFVIECLSVMSGGEVFVPKIPSTKVVDLARVLASECKITETGIRAGEKLHEVLVSDDEARHTVEMESMYVVLPEHPWWRGDVHIEGKKLPDGFRFASDNDDKMLSDDEIREMTEVFT